MKSRHDSDAEHSAEVPSTRSRASARVRRRLLDAAVVVFGQHGFEAARVTDIARRCDLTTGAVYSRWPTKREIFAAAVEHASPQRYVHTVSTSTMNTHEKLAALAENLLVAESTAYRDLMLEAAVVARRDDSLRDELSRAHDAEASSLTTIIEEGKAAGVIDESLDTKSIVLVFQSLGLGSHLSLTADATGSRCPGVAGWTALLERLIEAVAPSSPIPRLREGSPY